MPLTRDFSLSEFRQKGDPTVAVPANLVANVQHLANQLQKLRDIFGPITINSCYRTRARNTAVGGAKRSQHLTARAADFTIPGVENKIVYCRIRSLIDAGEMQGGGLGWYGNARRKHIHYDVRGYMSPFNKSGGLVPDCSKLKSQPPPEDRDKDEKPFMLKGEGDQVYVTNFVVKAKVISREHRDQLMYSGVQGPIDVDQSFIDAIQDAAP